MQLINGEIGKSRVGRTSISGTLLKLLSSFFCLWESMPFLAKIKLVICLGCKMGFSPYAFSIQIQCKTYFANLLPLEAVDYKTMPCWVNIWTQHSAIIWGQERTKVSIYLFCAHSIMLLREICRSVYRHWGVLADRPSPEKLSWTFNRDKALWKLWPGNNKQTVN